jgi:hypothetical protein
LDQSKGSAIKFENEKKLARTSGHYIVEATISRTVPNVDYAPLWIFSEGAREGGHEFDFEYLWDAEGGGRLEYNLHNGQGGYLMKATKKDLSGHRVRYEIIRYPTNRTVMIATSLTDGWKDQLEITPALVQQWAIKAGSPPNLRYPAADLGMYPVATNTRVKWDAWGGAWVPQSTPVDLTLHGYYFGPIGAAVAPGVTPPTTPVDPNAVVLDKFPTTKVARWNYNQVYHPIEGPQSGKQPDGWAFLFDNNVPNAQGELVHRLTNYGASGIKWENEKKLWKTQGHYITEATLPVLRNGVISNPLWLYSEGAAEGGHEFDFELMNGRIEYNLHNGRGGFNMKSTPKDLSNHRARFEIIRRPDVVTMRITSLTDGFKDELVITPAVVQQWAVKSGAPPNLSFPPNNIPMFPVTEHWTSRWAGWDGGWKPIALGESIDMILHGYKFLP